MILTHVVDIYREQPSSNRSRENYSLAAIGLRVNIQPSDNETTVISEGAFGRTYDMYTLTTASGVLESDKVIVTSGTLLAGRHFVVKGRKIWKIGFGLDHYQFILFESNE